MSKKSKSQSARKAPMNKPETFDWRFGVTKFEIVEQGLRTNPVDVDQYDVRQTRNTRFLKSNDYFSIITSVSISLVHKTDSTIEPLMVFWLAVHQEFIIEKRDGEKWCRFVTEENLTGNLEMRVLLNILQLAHTSLRGLYANLTRGTFLGSMQLYPTTAGELLPVDKRDQASTIEAFTLLV